MIPTKIKIIKLIMSGLFCIIFLFANATMVAAQENGNNAEEETPTETEDKSQGKKSKNEENDKVTKPKKSPKNFIPSEEISKDLAVSFPVDI